MRLQQYAYVDETGLTGNYAWECALHFTSVEQQNERTRAGVRENSSG